MYNILFVISTLRLTGPVRQLYNICKYLDRGIFSPTILTLSPEPGNSLKQKFEKLKIPVIGLNNSRFYGSIINTLKIKRIIHMLNPDIIHTHAIRADMVIRKLKFQNHISTLHLHPSEDYKIQFGKWIGKVFEKKHLRIIKSMDYTIACSNNLAIRMIEFGIFIKYINNGVDVKEYRPIEQMKKKSLRKKHHLCENTKIFLSVSELNDRKNVSTIIQCFNSINYQDVMLIIVGSGPAESKLKNLVACNCNIIFTGEVVNTNEYYNIADYFISASFTEGLPYSVLEAMASGLPVILSDIPAHRSIFKTKDEYPYFFSKLDSLNLKICIETIEKDDYKSISEKMHTIVRKNYSARKMSNRYQDFYKQILLHTHLK